MPPIMQRILYPFAALLGLVFCSSPAQAGGMTPVQSAYTFSFTGIDGQPLPLSDFRGKVVLVVNTASKCGLTSQYEGLEKLYETYKDQGLVILGVPSDDFGNQEPGSADDIKTFTSEKFHITFPLTQKTAVVGDNRAPFYAWAAAQGKGGWLGSAPRWNFHKYLIGRDGQLVDSFLSTTGPMSDAVTQAVETALQAQPL